MFDRCLYFNSNHLARVVGKIWKDAYAEVALAPSHAYLIRLVVAKPGLRQQDIAQELHLEKSTITRFIDKLVEEDYLRRSATGAGNLREQLVFPTVKAKKIAPRLNEIGDSLYAQMQEAIGPEDLQRLVALSKIATQEL